METNETYYFIANHITNNKLQAITRRANAADACSDKTEKLLIPQANQERNTLNLKKLNSLNK